MNARLRILLALEDGIARTVAGLSNRPGAPSRSTVHATIGKMADADEVTAHESGAWTVYQITDTGHDHLDRERRSLLAALYPDGCNLAVLNDEARCIFIDGDRILQARHTGPHIEVREVTALGTIAEAPTPLATLPPTVPLDRVAVEFGRLG